MQKITTVCRNLIIVMWFFLSLPLMAISLDKDQIQENKKLAEAAANKPAVSMYEKVLALVTRIEVAHDETEKFSNSITSFDNQLAALNKRYSQQFNLSNTNPESLEQYDLLFGQIDAELLRMQQRQSELNQVVITINERSVQIPVELQELSREESQVPVPITTGDSVSDDASVQLRQATLLRIASRRETLEMERLSSKNRMELARRELRLIEVKIEQLETLRGVWQQRRQAYAENEFEKLLNSNLELQKQLGDNAILQTLVFQNFSLLEQLKKVGVEWRAVSERRLALEKTLNQLNAEKNLFAEQLSVSTASAMLGAPLMERYNDLLRTVHFDDTRLKEAHVNRLRLNTMSMVSQSGDSSQSLSTSEKLAQEQLNAIYQQSFDATGKFYDDLILELVRFDALLKDLNMQADDLHRLMQKNSLWVENVSAIDLAWLNQVVISSVHFTHGFRTIVLPDLIASFVKPSFKHVYLLLAVVALIFRRRYRSLLNNSLSVWARNVGAIRTDRINETIFALLGTIALAFFWVLPFLFISLYLRAIDQGTGHLQALGTMFFIIARFVFVVRLILFSSLPNGLFIVHLRFPETLIRGMNKPLHLAEWIGSLLAATCLLMYNWPEPMVLAGIGRLLFLLLAVFVSVWIWFLIGEVQRVALYLNIHTQWLVLIRAILPALPIISIFAIALGYFSLAQLLLANAYQTLMVLLMILLGFMVIRRLFAIQERRLAYERAVERRNEERERRKKSDEETNSESPIEIEEFEINTDVLRSRSMSLLQLAAITIFIVAVSQIWSEFLLAFDWLNNVELWETVKTSGDTQIIEVISLADLIGMLIIFAVTVILAINLPSMIDLLILQNLDLEPGVGFATTTVTSYLVVIVGLLAAFNMIGIDWSKLQWLVAALGVGVGFGLQEIVANLVSGLIILFERPIRLGDLITVQGESGTVSRIRMRATTIVDFDRREVVVPNKVLLSEKITNWSLTDGITRVVINVGVAYGSDVKLVERLLLQAAAESAIALAEPPPEVFFNAFGNSTLDFELRVFAEEIGRRMPARDDLHHRIMELFALHGITIAFPQMDVHIVSDVRREGGEQGLLPPA